MIDGKPLTEIINETNENVKYLKGAKFTPNVKAVPDLAEAVKGATMVCFCLPHQFLKPLMPTIKESVAPGAKVLSAIKGIDFDDNGATPALAARPPRPAARPLHRAHTGGSLRLSLRHLVCVAGVTPPSSACAATPALPLPV